MAKFCKHCGRSLEPNEKCNCRAVQATGFQSVLANLFNRMGVDTPFTGMGNVFEQNKAVVPDAVIPNDGEQPIKQYEVATLRSRIRGQWAKGKLQVTNKRVLFRAAGVSYKGAISQQYEFAIDEIAGVEIKKVNRISPLNVVLGLFLSFFVGGLMNSLLSSVMDMTTAGAVALAVILGLGAATAFFLLRKKFWLKLICISGGIGILAASGQLFNINIQTYFTGLTANVADVFNWALLILWVLCVIFVSLVPDLVLCVKTKGASEAFIIRRKQHATLFKQEVEYTGFSEVLPGKDVDLMASEIGALIDDIQTLGDMAIDKWKETM